MSSGHAHHHVHKHAAPAAATLFGASVAQRFAGAAMASAALWLVVYWALN